MLAASFAAVVADSSSFWPLQRVTCEYKLQVVVS